MFMLSLKTLLTQLVDLVQLGKMDFPHKQHPNLNAVPLQIKYDTIVFFIETRMTIMTLLTVTDYLCHR